MLLRNFTNEKGRLYFFDKRFPEKSILESTPAKLFVERYLYTLYDESGGKDIRVEKLLADIERDANAIVEKIINAARAGKLPKLTPHEKKSGISFSVVKCFVCQTYLMQK